jgi:serine/threonine protein kinase/Flp pilus assembly protein TadD
VAVLDPIDDGAESDLTQTPLPPQFHATQATRVRPVDVIDLGGKVMYPLVGVEFGGFKLIDVLGDGAFARVFLATETKLADRLVALKLARKDTNESLRLARLQHTNIVPIHNAFRIDNWHVVQMPFFGRQTLADLLKSVIDANKNRTAFPKVRGDVFASTQMRATTARKTAPASTPASSPGTAPDSDRIRVAPEVIAHSGERQPSRELLVGMEYIDASVWIVSRLADGLSHAHAKDILHLDLKPHNILLSDDGQPMLLDFNLAFDRKRMDRDRVGGTWPYMSPEQICEYARRPGSPVDERSDLYSLGVILYELLTLKTPFEKVDPTDVGLTAAIEERMKGARDVRMLNPEVPSSLAAVVAKLLAPRPLDRYQTADELREDLRRHAENRPLAFAKDTSLRERAVKWHRRNPKASLYACVAALGLGMIFAAATIMTWSAERNRIAAENQAEEFKAALVRTRLDLASPLDAEARKRGLEIAEKWLTHYRVGDPGWTDAAAMRLLPDADRANMKLQLAETAALAAHAHWLNGRHAEEGEKVVNFTTATKYNEMAAKAFGDDAPAVIARQHAELDGTATGPEAAPSTTPADLYLHSVRLIARGEHASAIAPLTQLTQSSPDHYAGQFALGFCYETTGQFIRASERYMVAKPLGVGDARPAFARGIILYHQGRHTEADSEFHEAIARESDCPGLHYHRGLVRRMLNDPDDALKEFTQEIELKRGFAIMALALRAATYRSMNNEDAAKADETRLDRIEPVTDLEYVARGMRWLHTDLTRALADYQKALQLNPVCLSALQNTSSVYADKMQTADLKKALESSAAAVKAYPSVAKVRSGHAVILARLGERTAAHQEIEAALMLGSEPMVSYQAACVYSLTGADHAADRDQALSYLRQALRDGYRKFDVIMKDPDLDTIRYTPEYRQALGAAMELVK